MALRLAAGGRLREIWNRACLSVLLLAAAAVSINANQSDCHGLQAFHKELHCSVGKTESLEYEKATDGQQGQPIPKIIHQTWKSHDIPEQFQAWVNSWPDLNPGWRHVVWDDAENRQLIAQHYSWFLPTYDGLPSAIFRADAIRPFYMHRFGGVYADLDAQCFRPMEQLLNSSHGQAVVGRMGQDHGFDQSIPNAFMASPRGHEFWLHMVIDIVQAARTAQRGKVAPEHVTGPTALYRTVRSYSSIKERELAPNELTILPSSAVFPVNWRAKAGGGVPAICDYGGHPEVFDGAKCVRDHFPDAYSVQWWAHSWGNKKSSHTVKDSTTRPR